MEEWARQTIAQHGWLAYPILFIWTYIEGETILIIVGILAAIAAQQGHAHPNVVLAILSAFAGSLAGDQTWFYIGRLKGKQLLARRPLWQQRAQKVNRILEQHQNWLMLTFRFLYGLRNVTPFAIGMSDISAKKFLLFNTIGAIVWAISFGLGGFFLGEAVVEWLSEYKFYVLAGVAVVILVVWAIKVAIRRRRSKKAMASTAPQAEAGSESVDS